MLARRQLADVLRTVAPPHHVSQPYGHWQEAAERIEDQVWTANSKLAKPRHLL